MDKDVLFFEKQKFNQWWLWLLLLLVNGLFFFGFYKQVLCGQQFGNKPMSNNGLMVACILSVLITILIYNHRLETWITKDGIYVRFFPFHLSFKHFTWDTISKSFVREYNPIGEYGGWGLRLGLFGVGNAYNVSGNKGLQIEFFNRKKLLIGTKKPQEITAVLDEVKQFKK
ncbi:MAG TPA: hypothetical protein VGB63_09315 [Pedobacter sp.]|jgi:hypothetical protein